MLMTFILENRLLKQTLEAGDEATSNLKAYRSQHVDDGPEVQHIQSETKESIELDLSSFLYAQAESNYSELYWKGEAEIESKLMRMSLKNLEDQIGNSHILRCHRSFLINLAQVQEVTGNANGYRLQITGSEEGIPVFACLG